MNIGEAISNCQIKLYYQPIVSLQNQRTMGYEALARWECPEGNVWGPNTFLPYILGTEHERPWFERQIEQVAQAFEDIHPEQWIALNLPPSSLCWGDLELILTLNGCPIERLKLEVPECLSLSPNALDKLRLLGRAGFLLGADDLGAKYAGLDRLESGVFHCLKIDRQLIQGCSQSETKRIIIGGLVWMASRLDVVLIAEGIDNGDDALACKILGVEMGQGYHFGKAEPTPQ